MKTFCLSILAVFAVLGLTLGQFGGPGAGFGGGGGGIFSILIFLFVFIVVIQLLFPNTVAPTTAAPAVTATTAAMITVPVGGKK